MLGQTGSSTPSFGFGNSGSSNYAPPIGMQSISSEQYHSSSYNHQSSFSSQSNTNVAKTPGPWGGAETQETKTEVKKEAKKEAKKPKENKETSKSKRREVVEESSDSSYDNEVPVKASKKKAEPVPMDDLLSFDTKKPEPT